MAASPSSVLLLGYGDPYAANIVILGYGAGTAPTIATISGTIVPSATEADIVAGGKTIVITLTHDTWVAAGAAFDAVRQAIIDGLDSSGAGAFGWNNVVRAGEVVTAVVRSSDTVVTITLSAFPTYDISASETITVTVPSSALVTSASDVTGTPTFEVTAIAPPVVVTKIGGDDAPRRQEERFRREREQREELRRLLRRAFGITEAEPALQEPIAREIREIAEPYVHRGRRIDETALYRDARTLERLLELLERELRREAVERQEEESVLLGAQDTQDAARVLHERLTSLAEQMAQAAADIESSLKKLRKLH